MLRSQVRSERQKKEERTNSLFSPPNLKLSWMRRHTLYGNLETHMEVDYESLLMLKLLFLLSLVLIFGCVEPARVSFKR